MTDFSFTFLFLINIAMGIVQKDAFRTMIISYIGIGLGYLNKGVLFLVLLSTEEIGLLNLLLTIGILFAQVGNLGNAYLTWKFLPFFKNDDNRHNGFFPLLLLIITLGGLICSFLYLAFKPQILSVYVDNSQMFLDYYYWVLPIGIGFLIYISFDAYLKGFYKNIVAVFVNEVILRLAITVILVLYSLKLISFDFLVISHSLLFLLPSLILFVYLYQIGHLNFDFKSINISRRFRSILLQFSAFNYFNSMGIVLVGSLDIIMIASIVGLESTGVYATVVFLTSALLVPYRSIIRISSPIVAEHWKHREIDKLQELYTKVSSTGLLIGMSAFVIIWLNIDLLFSFLKPEFAPGIWVFFFLMMGKLLDMFFGINGAIFSTSKKYKYDLFFTAVLITTVYFCNLLFIPSLGMVGAAISSGIAIVLYNIGRIIFVWKIFNMHPFTTNQFKIIGLGLATIFIGEFIGTLGLGILLHFVVMIVLILVAYITPILAFNLEPDMKNFMINGWKHLTKKK
ncbi:MAG: O-antigen/teichoic acid export membrane protein [Lentimonas sp.]|jgi:O-antigen/teichoic acid export membrane protein